MDNEDVEGGEIVIDFSNTDDEGVYCDDDESGCKFKKNGDINVLDES